MWLEKLLNAYLDLRLQDWVWFESFELFKENQANNGCKIPKYIALAFENSSSSAFVGTDCA